MPFIHKRKSNVLTCIRGAAAIESLTVVGAALVIGYGVHHFATRARAKVETQGAALVAIEDTQPGGANNHTHMETVIGPHGPVQIPVPDRLAPDDPSRRDRTTMGLNLGVASGSLTVADPDDVHNARITGTQVRVGGELGGVGLGFERTTETSRTGTQITTKTTVGPYQNTEVTTDQNARDPGRQNHPYSGTRYPGGGR